MQVKKAQYEVYTSMLDNQVKHAKEIFKGALPKKPTESDVLEAIFRYSPEMMQSLNLQIFSEEHLWHRNGANAIFPESAEVLDNLLRARFQMDEPEGFSLPFQSFMVSVPQGYKVDGLRIPSFLVNSYPYHDMEKTVIAPFGKHARFKDAVYVTLDDAPEGDMAIALCYKDPMSTTAYSRTLISASQIPDLLGAESTEAFSRDLKVYENYRDVVGLSEYDLKIQRIMLRLVAAIGVYNMATEGKRLLPGLPGSQEPKMIGKAPAVGFRYSTLANAFPPLKDGAKQSAESYYRTWFFRQLRSERYYKGEYADFAKGSRYVFVSDTVVGQQLDAHTQKFSKA